MSNKINPMDQGMLGKIGQKVGDTGAAKKVQTDVASKGEKASRRSDPGDTVELTHSAKLLERLEKSLAALPEIDRAKVDAVKTAIEQGDYRINSEKIAEILLRTDRELGGKS